MSLRSRVFKFLDSNQVSLKECYKEFPDDHKSTVKHYYWESNNNTGGYIPNITLTNIDTIKEMEHSIQQIKDPVKRCENIARLHSMKLKPLVNKNEKSLKELFDAGA